MLARLPASRPHGLTPGIRRGWKRTTVACCLRQVRPCRIATYESGTSGQPRLTQDALDSRVELVYSVH